MCAIAGSVFPYVVFTYVLKGTNKHTEQTEKTVTDAKLPALPPVHKETQTESPALQAQTNITQPVTLVGYVAKGSKVNVVLSDGRTYTEKDAELGILERNSVYVSGKKYFLERPRYTPPPPAGSGVESTPVSRDVATPGEAIAEWQALQAPGTEKTQSPELTKTYLPSPSKQVFQAAKAPKRPAQPAAGASR